MANTYFKFKEFTIHQDKCAMKVCTDACLFGAWVGEQIQNAQCKIQNILDIGSGTGLLSLMLAQKSNATITAVDIVEQAALQAQENFETSPWTQRLSCINTSIQEFVPGKTYDLIISNPPFFEQSLRSENHTKNLAKHATELSLKTLVEIICKLLNPLGKCGILLPCNEFEIFTNIASANQLHLIHKANVQQTSARSFFRSMGIFTREPSFETIHETLIIKDDQNNYTPEFKALLKDYYLHL